MMKSSALSRSFAALCAAAALTAGTAGAQTLYSQANLVTNPGAGANGANVSALPGTTGVFGVNVSSTNNVRVADDFKVTSNAWTITGFRFFGYQTNSPRDLSSPFSFVGWQLWNGRPGDTGASIVAGNIATNSLTYTGFSGIYRTTSTALTNTQRPIMVVDASAGNVTLGSGSYWLEWTLGTVNGNVPPVTFAGLASSGNSRQFVPGLGGWTSPSEDNGLGLELPFEVLGYVPECDDNECVPPTNVVPEPSTYALMATGLIGLVGVARRRRSNAA